MSNVQRSVDSLQKIYAVIVALAISHVLLAVFDVQSFDDILSQAGRFLPELLSFFAVVVPFYHGMNTHLDKMYLSEDSTRDGALLIDFFIFVTETSLLFVFAKSIQFELQSFIIIALILVIDSIWGVVSHFIHYRQVKPSTLTWAIINSGALAVGALIYIFGSNANLPTQVLAWILTGVIVLRTILDYYYCWEFYFPKHSPPSA